MAGLEDLFGKLMTEDFMKSLAEGVKEGLKDGSGGGDEETWCHVNGGKPVKSWVVVRIAHQGTCEFSKCVAHYKKNLSSFLQSLPEGQGVIFLPSTATLEVTPNFGGN